MSDEATQAGEKLHSGEEHATNAVQDLRAAATAKAAELRGVAEEKVQEIRGRAEKAYTDARSQAESLRGENEQWVRDNPTRAILTALGAGFVLGLVFRR